MPAPGEESPGEKRERPEETSNPPAPQPVVFRKRSRVGNVRSKKAEEPGDVDGATVNVTKDSWQKGRGTSFSSKATKDQVDRLKFQYEGTGEIQVRGDMGATRVLETETAFDNDARAQREKFLNQAAVADGQYKGANGYTDWKAGFRREGTVTEEKAGGSHGPMRATQYMRASVRMDYQPDICKDYKETGFCSYGDTCKFLHDRGDYKSGWELEKEFDAQQKARQQRQIDRIASGKAAEDSSSGDEDSDDEELPFACYICRRPWAECQDPVVTGCQHYYCEQCALKHNAKNPNCYVCEKPTGGIFNVAEVILKKVKGDNDKEGAAAKTRRAAVANSQANIGEGTGWNSVS